MDKTFRKFIKYNICKQSFYNDLIYLYSNLLNNYNLFLYLVKKIRKYNYNAYCKYLQYMIVKNINKDINEDVNTYKISSYLIKITHSYDFRINKYHRNDYSLLMYSAFLKQNTFYKRIKYGVNLYQQSIGKDTIMIYRANYREHVNGIQQTRYKVNRYHNTLIFVLQTLI